MISIIFLNKTRDDQKQKELDIYDKSSTYLYDIIIMLDYDIGIKPRETTIRYRKLRSEIAGFKLLILYV